MNNSPIIYGSLFAMLSVILGAFGAHGLKEHLNEYSKLIYEKAVLYQMFHSIGILFIGLLGQNSGTNFGISLWCFIFGIVLFSGSLYLLALTDLKWIGMITPIGGMLFIAGWGWIIIKLVY